MKPAQSPLDTIKEIGIVGAGGAGFPTYAKLSHSASIFIVNAAECEPLLHKDKIVLRHSTTAFFDGIKRALEITGAKKALIGIKEKHRELIRELTDRKEPDVEIMPLDDFYPAGDEMTLIHETTGIVIEAGQLPITKNIVVSNVETVANIGLNRPVLTKFVGVGGAVENPCTFEVPLGVSYKDLLDQVVISINPYVVIEGGPVMGKLVLDLNKPVTKTTSALIVLPEDHVLATKHRQMASQKTVHRIGKSACDQCSFCTELCPRYLLGHPIQPHLSMRSLIFYNDRTPDPAFLPFNQFCCECNLCSLISCPEGLFPSTVCGNEKRRARENNVTYEGTYLNSPHPMSAYRKTPSSRLKSMLGLNDFEDKGPLQEFKGSPRQLSILLSQHIGVPARPTVNEGDHVTMGQKIGSVGDQLGVEIHAPLNGIITNITDQAITIDI